MTTEHEYIRPLRPTPAKAQALMTATGCNYREAWTRVSAGYAFAQTFTHAQRCTSRAYTEGLYTILYG